MLKLPVGSEFHTRLKTLTILAGMEGYFLVTYSVRELLYLLIQHLTAS